MCEEPLSKDVVNLICREIDRGYCPFLPAEFRACIFESPVYKFRACVVGSTKSGDENTDVLPLARRSQKIRKRSCGHISDSAVAHLLCIQVVKVWRHLVEEDQDRFDSLEEL